MPKKKAKKPATRRPRTRAASKRTTPITENEVDYQRVTENEVDDLLRIDESGMPPPLSTRDAPMSGAPPPPAHQSESAGSQGTRRSVSFTPSTPVAPQTPQSQGSSQAMEVETPEKDKEIRCLVGMLDHQERVTTKRE